jgi:hypothetical protein
LERWRYGDFCSQAHKDDFSDDLDLLKERIAMDVRRPTNRLKSKPETPVELPPSLDAPDPLPPPEAGFVVAPGFAPVLPGLEPAEQEQTPPAPRGKGDQWRLFAKVAAWSELPVAVAAASQKKQRRFVWIMYGAEPVPAKNGAILSGEYPAFLPHPELRQWQAQLEMARHSEPTAIIPSVTPLPMGKSYWVDDQGWRWIPESATVSVPDFGTVLAEHPVAAPWQDWTSGAGFTPRPSPTHPGQPAQPGAATPSMAPASGPPMPSAGTMPGQPTGYALGHPGAYAPAGPHQPAWPGNPAAPPFGAPAMPMQAAWPGGPTWAGGMSGYAPHFAALPPVPPWSVGLVWQELPPPLFNALVDPSHSVRPLPGVIARQLPPVDDIAAALPRAPQYPEGPEFPPAALAVLDCQIDPFSIVAPPGSQPARCEWQPRTLWRRMLSYPAHTVRTPQPGIPQRAAPPLQLQSRPLPPAYNTAPVLYSGRWID